MQPTRSPELQSGWRLLPSRPARYREHSTAGFSGSNYVTQTSPSVHTGSSSRGSRRAPAHSSARREPCRPLLGSDTTVSGGPAHRIGEKLALPLSDYVLSGGLSNKWSA